ncbi:MAG TPA: hypothetical protein VL136_07575 [Candidatus Babeliales bacterium]|nr:hypothetical protein [Candidatus Babeliales bacterium]
MPPDIAFWGKFTSPSCPAGFPTGELPTGVAEQPRKRWRGDKTFASRLGGFCDYELMTRLSRFLTPLVAGCAVTLLQVVMAVALLAPEKSITERYSALVQHDSYWFMNIIDRGYQTIVPPIDHKVMEVSNAAFFPAYPAIAALLRNAFSINTGTALLITAQLAAWGFWTYFFLFCRRWKIAPSRQFCGTLLILANPAAFFLVAAYSESLFIMTLLGFIYWSTAEGRTAKLLAAMHGIVMSATRIVGIVCAAFPLVRSVFQTGWGGLLKPRKWIRKNWAAVVLTFVAACGGIAFFVLCQLRWGHWDLYMRTQAAGWGIVPDYFAVVRPESYRWLVPALDNPTEMSQLAMTLGAVLFLAIAVCEFLPAIRRRAGLPVRAGIYFCAATIYYLSVSGVACVEMESMLRYEFSVHALIVLALLNFSRQFRMPPIWVRALGTAAVVLVSAVGLWVQGWYVWNFARGHWVA